ncbi:TonB-dependent receptor [Elongatibacter sediminis]|uniref:TonB-dependent receptor n=1 Tax=Elongatibacter sediminis TaxID=3119006 RepID=A0AAW9REB9_9GAMM
MAIALSGSALLTTTTATAQDGLLEEIIVTAQKREQSIQDVGITITAFSGAQIKELGFEDSFDIARMTPGVHISGNNGGQKTLFTIRGVTQNDFNDQTEAPVAVYVDESYVAFGQGQVFGLFDLDRVEILKGPQGTLFGRNATGGLVHYVSRRPTREAEGFADFTYGSYNQIRFEGAVGGPLSDTVSGRMSVLYSYYDEVLDNDYPERFVTLDGNPLEYGGEDTFNDDTLGLRGQLLFEPNDDVDVLLIGSFARTREGTSPFLELPTVPIFDAAGNHVGTIVAGPNETREAIAPDGTPIDHPLSFDADLLRPPGGNLYGPSCTPQDYEDLECGMDFAFEDLNSTDTWGVQGKLTWQLSDSTTLTAISDYKSFEKFQGLPADGGPASTINVLFEAEADTFTQEVRLNGEFDRTRWVAGAYYLNIDLETGVSITADPQDLFLPLAGVPWEDTALTQLETDSWSLFGQLEYDLSDSLTLIGGLRLIRENKDFVGEETFFLSTDPLTLETHTPLFSPQPQRAHTQNKNLWSGKLQLDWQPTDNLLVFAGINRGVKAGGFNAPFTFGAGFPPENIPYNEEILLAYEAGFKWDGLFGGTTRLNGSAYYYDYEDYQGFFFSQITGWVQNVDAEYHGVEVELFSSPTPNLSLMFNFSWIDAEIYDVQIGPGIFVDSEPSFTPEIQLAGLIRYDWPQTVFGGQVYAQASFNYADEFWDNIRNFDASLMPDYFIGNLRLGWSSADDHWDVAAFVNNINDERYFTIGYDLSNATGANSLVPGKPRWFGINVRYNYF